MKKRTYIMKDNINNFIRELMAGLLLVLVLGVSIPAAVPARADGVPLTGGTAWAWGYNNNGKLGNGTNTDSYSPVQVSNLDGVTAISAGRGVTLAARSDGTAWAWGEGDYGQLGQGSFNYSNVPVQVKDATGTGFLSDVTAVSVSLGGHHCLALKSDGTVWAWGDNEVGQLGTPYGGQFPGQVLDAAGTGYLTGVVAIAAGDSFSLALKSDGTVWAWGNNHYGQLGDGTNTHSNLPVQVKDAAGTGYLTGITAIAAGSNHCLALKSDGTVWAWGDDTRGQLGDGNSWTSSNLPIHVLRVIGGSPGFPLIADLAGITYVSAGAGHSLAIDSGGEVWAWGANFNGALGDGTNDDSYFATFVRIMSGGVWYPLSGIVSVSAGNDFSLAVSSGGTALAWGYNNWGQLGDGTTTASNVPVWVTGISGATAISAGYQHSAAIVSAAPPSSDATLCNLALSSGTLNPVFASATTTYTASVANSVASVNVTATVNESHATVTVNGQPVSSGQPSQAINLNIGDNTINVVVTAQDGTTTKTYTVTVTRQPTVPNDATLGSLTLSSGTLTPAFAPDTTSYTVSVDNSVGSVTVTPTVNESHATVTVNGQPVTSGEASQALNLVVGDNLITIVVTAQDGTTTRTYTLTVTRQPPLATYTLTMIAMSGGNTSPAGTHTYPAGTVVNISATPWDHWMFYCWSGDVDSFHPDATVTMDGDKTVTAHFDVFCMYAIAHSPVELRVYDSQNRVTGLVNGVVKEEIPNSSYNSTNSTVVVNPATDSYYYQVAGTGTGTYGLEVDAGYFLVGQTTAFNAIGIPIISGAIHQYTIDWDALSQGKPGVTVQLDLNGDGLFEISFNSDSTLTNDEFLQQMDTTPPVTTVSLNPAPNASGWNSTDVTANLTATDSGSGVKEIHYTLNGGAETIVPGATASFLVSMEGSNNITYFAKDNAGNTETPKSVTVKIDKTKPTININSPQAKEYLASENFTLDFAAADALSGISNIQATLNGPVTNGQVISLSTMEGSYTITVQAKDKADNGISKSVTFTVKSAKILKSAAIDKLNSAKTGDKKTDKTIDRAIHLINDSLEQKLWVDPSHLVYGPKADWLHEMMDRFDRDKKTVDDEDIDDDSRIGRQSPPGARNGITVFHLEMSAIMALDTNRGNDRDRHEKDNKNKPQPSFDDVISDLVNADMILAKVAITDAKGKTVVNPAMNKIVSKEIESAEKEFTMAMDAANKGQSAIAVMRFSHAWLHAQLAVKFATVEAPQPPQKIEPKENGEKDKKK